MAVNHIFGNPDLWTLCKSRKQDRSDWQNPVNRTSCGLSPCRGAVFIEVLS